MKLYFAVLLLFLAAFAGLAAGLLLKRKGLRGGCGSAAASSRDCQCATAQPPGGSTAMTPHVHADDSEVCADCPAHVPSQQGPQPPSSQSSA